MSDLVGTDLHAAIRHMIAASGKTLSDVSRELGRSRNFISVLFRDGATPRLDLMAKIAKVCGYRLVLLGHGEGLDVEPVTGENGSAVVVSHAWSVAGGDAGSLVLSPSGGAPVHGGLSDGANGDSEAASRDEIIDALIAQLEAMRES